MTDQRPAQDNPFPAAFDYDDDIPADLLARWTSSDPDRTVLLDLIGFLATAGALLVAGIGLVGLVGGGLPGGLGVVTCLAGLALAGPAAITRRRWQQRHHLSGRDIDVVLGHRREIRFGDWNQLVDRGQRFDSWPEEARLAHRAAQAVRAIQATAVWPDADLLDHSLRIDLPENVRRIQVAAWHLHVLRIEIGPRPENGSRQLSAGWCDVTTHHANSLQVLGQHVAALEDYRAAVDGMNLTVETARRTAHLHQLIDRAGQRLPTQDAYHELATEHLVGLRGELESVGGRLAAR
jgi:hypothetical protein